MSAAAPGANLRAPAPMPVHDVVIIGGGLAGLTLALQLRQTRPDLDVVVLERGAFPVPEITHKVGESTVELGSWYLGETLGLRESLDRDQLRKFGLRFYFGAKDRGLEEADELGVSSVFSTPTWQVDRGRLENDLARRVRDAGATIREGVTVRRVEVNGARTVHYRDGAGDAALQARWLVDAAGRTSPLKRSLGLARPNGHDINASWFRVSGELRMDDWSSDPDWSARTGGVPRWLSTNQLMGRGYWVWIIPLATNATSIGIVADPEYHPLDTFRSEAASLAWLERHEPGLAAAIAGREVLDFGFLRHPSHDCERVFGADRWALPGESGVFVDPLYSPGTDFIAVANSFITDLVDRDLSGEDISVRSRAFEAIYRSLYDNSLALYEGMYAGFGSADFMALKSSWDYSYYWSVPALLFSRGALARAASDTALRNELFRGVGMNQRLQRRLRAAAPGFEPSPGRGRFFDQKTFPLMVELNEALHQPLAEADVLSRITDNIDRLERLSGYIEARLDDPTRAACEGERELLGELPRILRD